MKHEKIFSLTDSPTATHSTTTANTNAPEAQEYSMSSSRGPSPKGASSSPASPHSSTSDDQYSTPPSSSSASHASFLSDLVATPTGTAIPTKMDFQSPMPPHARLASAAMLQTPAGKKALGLILLEGTTTPSLELPMSCNFDALSNHFHLPLKLAAEKFGVRATAFKKRCRAIGIRHWPYRKVRSLKRSLQELGRCRDQGILNDKQHHQLAVFQTQLDKLLSPETYGIDPSGRLPPGTFDRDDEDDNDHDSAEDADDDDMSCASNQSPRVESAASFSDFKITCFRAKRAKKSPSTPTMNHLPSLKRGDFSLPSGIVTSSQYGGDGAPFFRFPSGGDTQTPKAAATFIHGDDLMPSVSVRFAPNSSQAGHGLPGFESYDPFFQDFKSEFTLTMEDFGGEDSVPAAYGVDTSPHDDFFPYMRSPTMASLRASTTPNGASHWSHTSASCTGSGESNTRNSDEPNETGDDDVFLQISPDYGCLV